MARTLGALLRPVMLGMVLGLTACADGRPTASESATSESAASESEAPAPTGAGRSPAEQANIALMREYYDVYADGDPEALRRFLAPDVVWRIPGHHPLAGEKRGQDEVIAFFTELARGKFKAEPILFQAQGDKVVDVHRGWSNIGSAPEIDQLYTLMFTIRDDRIVEAQNFVSDPASSDAFYWAHYPLAALPQRLAEGR